MIKRTKSSLCANLSGTLGMFTTWTFKSKRSWYIHWSCAIRNQESNPNYYFFPCYTLNYDTKIWCCSRVNVHLELSKRAHVLCTIQTAIQRLGCSFKLGEHENFLFTLTLNHGNLLFSSHRSHQSSCLTNKKVHFCAIARLQIKF